MHSSLNPAGKPQTLASPHPPRSREVGQKVFYHRCSGDWVQAEVATCLRTGLGCLVVAGGINGANAILELEVAGFVVQVKTHCYTYDYVCMHIYIHIYIYTYMHTYVQVFIQLHAGIYTEQE